MSPDDKEAEDKDPDLEKVKKPGDETSDEEQAWLNALESGELDEFEEKQKQKDPTLLTKRQVCCQAGYTDISVVTKINCILSCW